MATVVLNMHEAKTHLSEHIARLRPGDRIVLCRRNRPVAEIRPVTGSQTARRPVGRGKGLAIVPESFFEPLPDDVIEPFERPR